VKEKNDDIHSRLSHCPPSLLVDEVVAYTPGVGITCRMTVDGSESFFRGHFPMHPVVPGALELEAVFQAAELFLMLEEKGPDSALTKISSARFQRPLYPPGYFIISVKLKAERGTETDFLGSLSEAGEEELMIASFTLETR
jgi:3-hydroxymyristoyl/3-hydroxydecanoyl-(acyl carrier protein) dehydratase